MSGKRGASDYLTKDGPINGSGMNDEGDQPQRATAAQLASRKIKQAKARRPGASSSARPNLSGGLIQTSQSSGFPAFGSQGDQPQGSLFGGSSHSFPPTNGGPTVGNGSPSASFGGFGSGGNSGGAFNFSAGGPISNPFSSGGASTIANGTSAGGFNFNFGQPPPTPSSQPPSGASFVFGGSQHPTSQAPSFFSSTVSQPAAASPFSSTASQPPSNSFFSTTASTSASGNGIFGAKPAVSQQSSGSIFGQPLGQTSSAPAFGGAFGNSIEGSKTIFGQPIDDAMSTSPDNSPQKGVLDKQSTPFTWNKPGGVPVTRTESNSSESDHPHIEEETPRLNPFASIPRVPAETPKPIQKQSEKSNDLEQDKPHIEEETKRPNPFASIARVPPTPQPDKPSSFSPLPKQSTTTASPFSFSPNKSTNSQSNTFSPGISSQASGQKNSTLSGAESKPKQTSQNSSTFQSATFQIPPRDSGFSSHPSQKSSTAAMPALTQGSAASVPSSEQNIAHEPIDHWREIGSIPVDGRMAVTSKWMTQELRLSMLREDNIQPPAAELELTEEETRYYYRDLKLARLNNSYKNYFASSSNDSAFQSLNLIPMMANYIQLFEELMGTPIQGALTELILAHGKEKGSRMYDQQQGRIPLDTTGKRKPGESISKGEDDGKKLRNDAQSSQETPRFAKSSETASKFKNFLEQSEQTPTTKSTTATNGVSPGPANIFSASVQPSAPAITSASPFSFSAHTSSTHNSQPSATLSSGFKVPKFGASTGTNFMAQFGASATKEAEKEKQKAKEEDFDSDEDDEAEWERKYEEKQAAKKAQLEEQQRKLKAKFVPGKGFTVEEETPSQASSSSLAPPSTNGGLFSRSVSPTASTTGGASVFDAPRSNTPTLGTKENIFGHLSDRGSDVEGSAKGDADDEDTGSDEADEVVQSKSAETRSERSSNKFGPFSESDDAGSDTPTAGRSLFERVSRDKPERTPLSTTEGNQPGLLSTAKTATSDHTWKPDSPIKFGQSTTTNSIFGGSIGGFNGFQMTTPSKAAGISGAGSTTPSATPGFSMFGDSAKTPAFQFTPAGSVTPLGSPTPKPSTSTLFGATKPTSSLFPPTASSSTFPSGLTSAATSRATTPGVSDVSGAESTAGEQEDVANEPQSDLVGMLEDKKGHDMLFECAHAKASRYESDKTKIKNNNSWPVQGVGPLAVLKSQETGVVKILMKRVPNGGVVINSRLLPQSEYTQIKKRARFMIVDTDGPKTYLVLFGSEEEAATFVRVCNENKSA